MALSKSKLSSELSKAFEKSSSSSSSSDFTMLPEELCRDVAETYDSWFKSAKLNTLAAVTPGPVKLSKSLRSFALSSWGQAFAEYWSAVTWVPTVPAETSGKIVNSAIGAAMQAEISKFITERLVSFGTTEEFVDKIAEIVYTYTKRLTGPVLLAAPPGSTTPGVII